MELRRLRAIGILALALVATMGVLLFAVACQQDAARDTARTGQAHLAAWLRVNAAARELRLLVDDPRRATSVIKALGNELAGVEVLRRSLGHDPAIFAEATQTRAAIASELEHGRGDAARARIERLLVLSELAAEKQLAVLDVDAGAISPRLRWIGLTLVLCAMAAVLALLRSARASVVAIHGTPAAASDRLRAVGTLAAGVAHEINNPLSYVTANLHYLRRSIEAERPELVQPIDDACEGAERIQRIVRDLVAFGRADDARESVDLHSVVEDALRMASRELEPCTLVRLLAPVPPVLASRVHLGQVLFDLLVNAAHAVRGRPVPEIRIVTGRDAAGNVMLEVADRGGGVPSELRERIFDPFFTTRPEGEGRGLGLSVCAGIVTSHGGTLELVPGEGEGSRFRVTLPPLLG